MPGQGCYDREPTADSNPTCWNFQTETPIERLTTEKKTRGKRAVNRKGRAICRIMQHYGFNDEMLARIFGESKVTIVKVLTNHYHDDLSEDYQAAGREFQVKFPPRALAEVQATSTSLTNTCPAPEIQYSDDDSWHSDEGSEDSSYLTEVSDNSEPTSVTRRPDPASSQRLPRDAAPVPLARTPSSFRPNLDQVRTLSAFPEPIEVVPQPDSATPRRIKIKGPRPQQAPSTLHEPPTADTPSPQTDISGMQHKRSREEDPTPGPSTANASSSGVRTVKKPRYARPADNGEARPPVQDRRPVTPVAAAAQSAPVSSQIRQPDPERRGMPASVSDPPVSIRVPASSSPLSESPPTNQTQFASVVSQTAPSTHPGPENSSSASAMAPPATDTFDTAFSAPPLETDPRAELSTFLQNVLGMDFSVHLDLLLAQGIDKQKLQIMARWSSDARQRFLHCLLEDGESLLRGKKGLSLFEIMSLESVIGELGK
ncbi:hypothetical protein B0H13DRAFT_2447608 [Mycena leptocephala]|nr:hypothetical protein B0H13DRAFT_2447608 [Mycena leptocephala]